MEDLGRLLLVAGGALIVIGLLFIAFNRAGMPLGRLPGDLSYRGRHFSFFAPLGTSLLLSVGLTLVLYLLSRFRR